MNGFLIRIFGAGLALALLWHPGHATPQVFLNGSSSLLLSDSKPILSAVTSLAFRTCGHGTILRQSLGNDSISLAVLSNGALELSWSVKGVQDAVMVGANMSDNRLHWLSLRPVYGMVWLHVDERQLVLVASDTIRPYLLSLPSQAVSTVVAPSGFHGCLSGGANLPLAAARSDGSPPSLGACPLLDTHHCKGYRVDPCFDYPCWHSGRCVVESGAPRCICTARYSGSHCEADQGPLCKRDPWVKQPCTNGGTCVEDWRGNSTRCQCKGPWTGSACQEPAPDAQCEQLGQQCQNGGTCMTGSGPGRTFCLCLSGYAGVHCELNVGECQLGLCRNGGVCTEGAMGPLCNCLNTGFHGPLCDEDIDECADSGERACFNGGTCFNRPGSFECACPPGFGGPRCEQLVGPCEDGSPCMNGGVCQVEGDLRNNSNFTCRCTGGAYSGRHCELPRPPCPPWGCTQGAGSQCRALLWCGCIPGYREDTALAQCVRSYNCTSPSNPCLYGGLCHDFGQTLSLPTGGPAAYQCSCAAGFRGKHCELTITVDPCELSPCQNGATCYSDQWGPVCRCLPGYSGDLCERRDDLCVSSPCFNGGTCHGLVNDFVCTCEAGWTGKQCDRLHDPCQGINPCLHGTCKPAAGGQFSCQCLPGYSGELCESQNVCMADCVNGTLLCREPGWQCDCRDKGESCGKDQAAAAPAKDACSAQPCANNATCRLSELQTEGFVCACPLGLRGSRCEENVDECAGHQCPSGMQCIDRLRAYECRCTDPQGACGSFAQQPQRCRPNPCVSGATCRETDDGSFQCECPRGYQGARCAEDVDECAVHLCQHDSFCRNHPGRYECFCRPGYTGTHCHIEVNECLSQPCRNGATCVDGVNEYKCVCPGGYLGDHCEIDFNECDSSPCMHGSTCLDQVNGFRCVCPAGYEGLRCEIDIDECQSGPCLNGASCLDLVNGYECNCTDTGFKGVHCESNIDDCYPGACQHGGTCEDRVRGFYCHCFDGYEGAACEVDVPDCDPPTPSTPPCENGAACLERSNASLYQENYLGLFQSFSYATAAGFVCLCPPGFNGTRCEVNIDDCPGHDCSIHGRCVDLVNAYRCECEPGYEGADCGTEVNECEAYQPCRNGATCRDLVANYQCVCVDGFGDKNCSTLLIGCQERPCLNGARCEPFLTRDGQHSYRCHCLAGFAGDVCQTVTTASLGSESAWKLGIGQQQHEEPSSHHRLQMQFRTTLPSGLLARVALNKSWVLLIALSEGRLLVKAADDSVLATIGEALNNAEWKGLLLEVSSDLMSLSLLDGPNTTALLPGYDPAVALSSVVLGSGQSYLDDVSGAKSFQKQNASGFVGCMREVRLDGVLQLPRDQAGLTEGCLREEQCVTDTCSGQGTCVDLWNQHECHCHRPYYGERCNHSHPAATFGHHGSLSFTKLRVKPEFWGSLGLGVEVSLFVRTRSPSGLLFYLGAEHSSTSPSGDESFLAARLRDGRLEVLLLASGSVEPSSTATMLRPATSRRLDDGKLHFVQVWLNETWLGAAVDGQEGLEPAASGRSGGVIAPHVMYLGWLQTQSQPPLRRRRRQAGAGNGSSWLGALTDSVGNIDAFKGVLQDLRLNDRPVPLLKSDDPASTASSSNFIAEPVQSFSVQNGVVGDDVCNGQSPPCHNGATCKDIWNAYECLCPPSYRGKHCEEVKPCVLNSCPNNSTCQDLEQGFECVSSATFDANRTTTFRYQAFLQGEHKVDSISLWFRTRSRDGGLLHLASGLGGSPFFSLALVGGQVEARWHFGFGEQTVRFGTNATQGEWREMRINISSSTINATLSLDDVKSLIRIDDGKLGLSDLLKEAVVLGGDPAAVSATNPQDIPFEGCLKEVRLGGILLPFFTPDRLTGYSDAAKWDRFELLGPSEPLADCILCQPEQCAHGGTCQDPRGSYVCVCPPAYEGEHCELDVDECAARPCLQGAPCVNLDGGFRCDCPDGYTGKRCEERIWYCSLRPCQNGATCEDGEPGHFSCFCTEDFEGQNCTDRKVITCDQAPCLNNGLCYPQETIGRIAYRCECEHGYEGTNCERLRDFCESAPCLNGATCKGEKGGHRCVCADGYRGPACAELIDFCREQLTYDTCLHGGRCIPHVGGFSCDCVGTGYEGGRCETNVDECVLEVSPCEHGGTCLDRPGSYECVCPDGRFGRHCEHNDSCQQEDPCRNGAPCTPLAEGRFFCNCTPGYHGLTCALLVSSASLDSTDLKLVIGLTVACVFLLAFIVGATVFLRMAKKKRATRGTYSPSNQEMFGARVEMNPVMKPPPEERLI